MSQTVDSLIAELQKVSAAGHGGVRVIIEEVGDGYFGDLLYVDTLTSDTLLLLGEAREVDAMPDVDGLTRNDSGEVEVRLADGWSLVSNSEDYLSGDYVRILRPDGSEYQSWFHNEWRDEPQVVMGAIVNALAGHRPLDHTSTKEN